MHLIVCYSFYLCLSLLLKTTQVLISAIIVATCRTTRTAVAASSEVELPLLLVVSPRTRIRFCVHGILAIDASACADKLPSKLVGNCVDSVLSLER